MQLNQKLAIVADADFNEVSAPVSMDGGNAAHFEIFLYSGGLGVAVEGSNDGENWTNTAAAVDKTTVGVNPIDIAPVKYAYLRLRYGQKSGGVPTAGVLSCTVHVSEQ